MAYYQAKHNGSAKVFDNPVLEKMSRTHISVPLIIFSIMSAYLLYAGANKFSLPIITLIGLFLAGLTAFSLIEYLMHRFVFHMSETTKAREKFVYTAHGSHHEYPKDKDRLAMPIPASLFLSTLFFLLYRVLLGDLVYGFLPGFLMGYAFYLWVHYMVHAFQPPNNVFKILWIHHGIHHYKQPERAFGVSSPIWDYIFRTMPK
jgi:sterol desaturase/sphingolipid hydroxylase (fatty acid hydroxylase superfamily)